METKQKYLRDDLKRLGKWLRNVWESGAVNSADKGYQKSNLEESVPEVVEEEESAPQFRLHFGELGIFVQCSSCGVLHELDAVCHRCGAVLCNDRYNCRRMIYSKQIESNVVVCPECEQILM